MKYFQRQIANPKDVLRALIATSVITAMFGLITIGRSFEESDEQGNVSWLMVTIGAYLFLNFIGLAWAAYSKLKSTKDKS